MHSKFAQNFTRRRFLKIMALAGATAAIDWHSIEALAASTTAIKNHPVVVIGSGLGGLISAAYLAQNGFPVTLMEKHDRPGGYATAFDRAAGKYSFEVSLHATVAENAMPQKILSELGLWQNLDLVDTPDFCRIVHPEFDLTLPAGDPQAFMATLVQAFPHEKNGIQAFIADMAAVQAEMRGRFGQESVMDRLEKLSLSQWLDSHTRDKRIQQVLSILWGYYGLPPSRMNALYFAIATGEYIIQGGQYYRTRSQDLSDLLMQSVVQNGGEVLMNTEAARIGVHAERVTWVEDIDGIRHPAQSIVANTSIPEVLNRMLPAGSMPSDYIRRMDALSPSISSCIVWLGLNQELRGRVKGYEISIGDDLDPEIEYKDMLAGNFDHLGLGVTVYDNLFEGYSRPGTSTLMIMSLCGYEPWQQFETDYRAGRKMAYNQAKQNMQNLFINRVEERLIPGLGDMIAVADAATPLTNWYYTGNPQGAIYGFARPLEQLQALDVRTPIKGLYLASAWTHGGGYTPAMMAGRQAAEALVADCKNMI